MSPSVLQKVSEDFSWFALRRCGLLHPFEFVITTFARCATQLLSSVCWSLSEVSLFNKKKYEKKYNSTKFLR